MDIQERLDRLAPEELTEQERDELRAVLTTPLMLKALRLIRLESQDQRNQFLSHNLQTMEGIHHSVKLQGRVGGLDRAIDILSELAGMNSKENSNG